MRPDLQALLRYWQAELRLQDWQIRAEYVKNLCTPAEGAATGEGGTPAYGLCAPLPDNKTARIWIRDPVASDDGVVFTVAMVEAKLVHELFHCPMSEIGAVGVAAAIKEEQITWATSEALVRLKGTAQGKRLARAAAAHAAGLAAAYAAGLGMVATTAPRRAAGPRRTKMDPIKVLLMALRALLALDDPKPGLEALIKEMDGAGAEPDGDEPPAAAEPGAPGEMPPAARAADTPPGAERPARAVQYPLVNGILPERPLRRAAAPVAKPLTIADVQRVLNEDRQRGEVIAAARASRVGMTPALEAHLATRPLAEVRVLVDSLEVRPTAGQPILRAAVAVGAPPSDGDAGPPTEALSDEAKRYLDQHFPGTPRLTSVTPAPRAALAAAVPTTSPAALPAAAEPAAPAREPGMWSIGEIRAEQRRQTEAQARRAEAARGGKTLS